MSAHQPAVRRSHTLAVHVVVFAAGAAGFIVNGFGLTVLGGTEFVFGGIFSLAAAYLRGPWWGGLVGAMAFSRTWITWEHPIGLICYTGEAIVVGWLTARRGMGRLTALVLYWALVGTPIIAAFVTWQPYPFPSNYAVIIKYPLNSFLVLALVLELLRTETAARLSHSPAAGGTQSLRKILLGRFGAISVIPLVVLAVVFGHLFDQTLRDRAARRLQNDAAGMSRDLAAYLQEHDNVVEMLAEQIALSLPATPEHIRDMLDSARTSYPGFLTMIAAAHDGRIVAYALPVGWVAPTASSVADRDYFVEVMKTRSSYVGGVFRGRSIGNDLIVALSAPVIGSDGSVQYVVEASLNLGGLNDQIEHFAATSRREVAIVDPHDLVVMASRGLQAEPLTSFASHELSKGSARAESSYVCDLLAPGASRAERYMAASSARTNLGWRVYAAEPVWVTQRVVGVYYLATLVLTGVAMAFLLVATRRTTERITGPLKKIVAATDALARQEAAEVEPDVSDASREIAQIGRSLHAAALTLSRSNAELTKTVGERDRTQGELRRVLLHLDETVQERTRELEESRLAAEGANHAKSEFLAAMSHELRTPLNVILGMAQVLEEGGIGALNERQIDCARSIQESGTHLLSLINDILDLSKIEAGMLELEIQETEVGQVCEASLRFIRESAQKKGLTVVSEVPDGLEMIDADPRRLRQVLINLLHNAVKFTAAGGRITLRVEHPNPASIAFTVSDTGIGIAPEYLPRLFRSFVQIDSSLTREHSGTGLGLALVDKMVRMHGGSVSVESTPGVGSAFTITLPCRHDAQSVHALSPELRRGADDDATVTGNPLVLIADDDAMNIEVMRLVLEPIGCRIAVASDGIEAVAMARALGPSLVITDIQMPGLDGYEVTRRIRASPETAGVPVFAVTAMAMANDRLRCIEAGATLYFSKPIQSRVLRHAVADVLARRATGASGEPAGQVRT